ncbi:Protein unc-80 [Dirofilaria immitis]
MVRTSGVLLVASVSSYVIYRVCTRFLGRNFIWTILEQARFDMLARNETYLLNSRMSCVVNDKYDSCCLAELIDDKENDCSNHTLATVPSSDHLRRTRQLYENLTESSKKLSEITSKHQRHSTSLASQSFSNEDFISSEKSASLHLLWDDPQWDEETDFCFYGNIVHRGQHSAPSDVSDMTEFRAAKELFEGSNDYCKINKEDQKNQANSNREGRSIDFDTNDFIQRSCMVDSKHLYQITSGFITRTNSISISSERSSSQSFLSLRQRLVTNPPSGGLLELIQSSTTSPIISAGHLMTSMTDSGISKGTNSTSIDAKCNFGTEIFSSEDGAVDMMPLTLTINRNSIIKRNNLNLINEDCCSMTTSAQSVEWFEDDYCSFSTNQELGKPLEIEIDDPLAACFSGSSYNQICSINSENRQKHLYKVTRDLMAWARDQFAPKSPQLKALQSLYISRQCWRKIGLKRSSNCSEQFLNSLLHLMLIRGIPFFSCSDVLIVIKREIIRCPGEQCSGALLTRTSKICDFLPANEHHQFISR